MSKLKKNSREERDRLYIDVSLTGQASCTRKCSNHRVYWQGDVKAETSGEVDIESERSGGLGHVPPQQEKVALSWSCPTMCSETMEVVQLYIER